MMSGIKDSPDRFLEGAEHISYGERLSLRVVKLACLVEGDRNEDHTIKAPGMKPLRNRVLTLSSEITA